MSSYVHGEDLTKWWIYRDKEDEAGSWIIGPPIHGARSNETGGPCRFDSGAAALEAFANGQR